MLPLGIYCWVYISVQCDVDTGMSQNFTEAFDIGATVDTIRGKRVPEYMKIMLFDACIR